MGKLSSIEEIESRTKDAQLQANVQQREAAVGTARDSGSSSSSPGKAGSAQEPAGSSAPHAAKPEAAKPASEHSGETASASGAPARKRNAVCAQRANRSSGASVKTDMRTTAQDEADFHGLDESSPLGVGHKTLIGLAVVVFVFVVIYVLNYWMHFF